MSEATMDLSEAARLEGCECEGLGFVEMTELHGNARHVERCDLCKRFATDEDALDAAISIGWEPDTCDDCKLLCCGLCGDCHTCDPADDEDDPCTYGLTLVVNHAE